MVYGYLASRAFVIFFILFEVIILLIIQMYRLCGRIFGYKIRKILSICVVTFCVALIIGQYRRILSRKEDFRQGILGISDNMTESDCKINDNVFLWANYIPRKSIHRYMNLATCKPNEIVTEIEDTNSTFTKMSFHCPSDTRALVRFIPNLHTFSFSEVGRKPWSRLESFLQENILERRMVTISNFENNPHTSFFSARRMKNDRYSLEYDSELYETIIVKCGDTGEVVSRPRKSRIEKRIKRKLSLDEDHAKPNIIIIVLDSESRKRFEYDFPKTINLIEKKSSESDIDVFQFFKFNAIGVTSKTVEAMFTGKWTNKPGKNDGNRNLSRKPLWEIAKEEGYLTVLTEDQCQELYSKNCGWYPNAENNDGLPRFDYHYVEPFCMEEYQDPKAPFSIRKGLMRIGRRCIFGKDSHRFQLEYMKKIQLMYPNNPKFMVSWFNPAHEATMQGIQWMDNDLEEYLSFLIDDQRVFEKKNTVLMIMGDHGNNIGVVLSLFEHGKVERVLPALYILTPKKKFGSDGGGNRNNNLTFFNVNTMKKNQFRYLTVYDLYFSLRNILVSGQFEGLERKEKEEGVKPRNIFIEEIEKERSCISVRITPHECACEKY